ncbi:hypothetical protein LCER1_G007387, partial [Lachnellula cervina]
EFHHYWRVTHPQAWLSVRIVQSNILKYSQFHVDNPITDDLSAKGLPMAEYDGGRRIPPSRRSRRREVFKEERGGDDGRLGGCRLG